jgi:hypothetical protein
VGERQADDAALQVDHEEGGLGVKVGKSHCGPLPQAVPARIQPGTGYHTRNRRQRPSRLASRDRSPARVTAGVRCFWALERDRRFGREPSQRAGFHSRHTPRGRAGSPASPGSTVVLLVMRRLGGGIP